MRRARCFTYRFIVVKLFLKDITPIYSDDRMCLPFISVCPHETRVMSAEFPDPTSDRRTFGFQIKTYNAQADMLISLTIMRSLHQITQGFGFTIKVGSDTWKSFLN